LLIPLSVAGCARATSPPSGGEETPSPALALFLAPKRERWHAERDGEGRERRVKAE